MLILKFFLLPFLASMAHAEERLPEDAFEIVFFHPGTRDNGSRFEPIAHDLYAAIQAQDYSLTSNRSSLLDLYKKILPFGHDGELLLRVKENGFIRNEAGPDFSLFENVLPGSESSPFQEHAAVGVSESADAASFHWFSCDPEAGVLEGCLGVMPTNRGGDRFDLSTLGLEKARYIWIKDLSGASKNWPSALPSEGCDLDAVRLDHAYVE